MMSGSVEHKEKIWGFVSILIKILFLEMFKWKEFFVAKNVSKRVQY